MTDKTPRRTSEIEVEMKRLEIEYEVSALAELRGSKPSISSLIKIASANTGSWSGGSCHENTIERITREVALKLLADLDIDAIR